MRTITVGQFVSLDGVVEAPEKWHMSYVDEEMMTAMWSEPADTMLLGRVTYETFAGAFAHLTDDDPLGARMNQPEKLVVSRSLSSLAWRNSRLLPAGDVAERVAELKAAPGGPISVVGSISVVRLLLRAGLVDRLSLFVHPLVVGGGQRLFEDEGPRVQLTLEKCDVFRSGVTHHRYAVG
ncbi:dihydrofolate reductase family protein [Asanoa sp. WMMD1127]|uniref:dihydrofolate reductase family protein n=1 Tax=Asanoa sp. WMMD1127 TaxID=3016107 RepID=UPI002417F197|nr:dihydrofolate reductase family protein [Asanoa sp. WMMD1127]MDG4823177.1 dihydrofolate reductase family protein [Asanoa sp. WMMD1127]